MRLLVAAIVILGACKVADAPPPIDSALSHPGASAVLPAPDGRVWLQGDFHVHSIYSTDTDWSRPSTPADIRTTAIARGLEFVLLTDHSNSTGSEQHCREHSEPNDCVEQEHLHNLGPEFPFWASAATLRDEAFLLVDGNEASPVDLSAATPRGHVNIVPRDLTAFNPDWIIVDRPSGAVTGGWAIGAAHARGALAIVNHPYSPGGVPPWTEYDWTSFAYDAMEVYNGSAGWDDGDAAALDALRCDWSRGRHVAAVGASDNHRVWVESPGDTLNPALGDARTSVLVASLAWDEVIAAVVARHTVAHDPWAFAELRLYLPDGRVLLPGDVATVDGPVEVVVELGGWIDETVARGAEKLVLRTVRDGACTADPRGTPGQSARVTVAAEAVAELTPGVPPPPGNRGGAVATWRGVVQPGTTFSLSIEGRRPLLGGRGQAVPTPIRLAPAP